MGTGKEAPRHSNLGRCVIIAAGEIQEGFNLAAAVSDAAFVICADGGYDTAVAAGITPDLFVGDKDSVITLPKHCEQVLSPAEKDDTDTMLAVKLALARGHTHITIIGGLGGRLDHTIANLQTLLYCAQHGARAELAGAIDSAMVIQNESVTISAREGYVSVFALTERCEGVTLKGLRYPLCDVVLTNSFPIGVSNEFCAPAAEITVRQGCLLLVFSGKRGKP